MNRKIRMILQQPALPTYRYRLFHSLTQSDVLEPFLYYGSQEPDLPNCDPDGIASKFTALHCYYWNGICIAWHQAQLQAASHLGADLVVLNWNTRFMSLLPAMLICRLRRVPVVLWGHGYSKSESRTRRHLREVVGRLADAVVLYDRFTARRLTDRGFGAGRVFVAENGLDRTPIVKATEQWRRVPDRLAQFRARHRIGDNTLIYIGRLHQSSGLAQLLESIPQALEILPSLRLVVIGTGEPEGTRLRELAKGKGIAHAITWCGPLYAEDEIAPWMLNAQLFVYPTNVGLSLIHAFNYGLPAIVLGPSAAHNPEITALRDQVNGLIVEAGQPAALARAITDLLEDRERLATMSVAAMATAEQGFNVSAMQATFEELAWSMCRHTATTRKAAATP